MADALDRAAIIQFMSGELDRAGTLYQESLALAREAGHRLVVARSIGVLRWWRQSVAKQTRRSV